MNVPVKSIDTIVLSHGHFDHGNGLSYLQGGKLICHPGCFVKRYRRSDHGYIGLKSTREELSGIFELNISAKPVKISEKIFFLGEIPRVTDFESKESSFVFEDSSLDLVLDDSALALVLPEGLFVITGCGHAGIVNTLEHAMNVTGINKLSGIMGGFHLKDNGEQAKQTIKYLKKSGIKHVIPSHCTELPALTAFYRSFGFRQVKTGEIFKF
jgi:7,8-dihydropterin-6-yl-methyl-4-(beta-D-ribofuranosyl)aminobenzene 5'-phosphate synthase